jgi:hypothetical protein
MSKQSVFCLTRTEEQAQRIVAELRTAGFSSDDISVLFPDRSGSRDFAHEHHTKAPEGATTGGVIGGVVGGAVGWAIGVGAIAIPGIGPFIAAGPIMAMLGGAGVGGAIGGIIGVLSGMGMPELEAKRYEGKIKSGNILVSVHAEDSDQAKRAKDVFERAGATDVSSASESKPPKAARR